MKKSPNPLSKVATLASEESIPFQAWFHRELENDEVFRSRVEERLAELLEIDRQFVEKRQARGFTQAQLARYARLGQPYLARLEAGALKNVELKTLVKAATALGCNLRLILEEPADRPRPLKARVRPR